MKLGDYNKNNNIIIVIKFSPNNVDIPKIDYNFFRILTIIQSEYLKLPFSFFIQKALIEEYQKKSITMTTLESLQGCLNKIGENAIFGSLTIVAFSGTNILLDFFLLIGACCGVRYLLYFTLLNPT